jgi:hypothetical protein
MAYGTGRTIRMVVVSLYLTPIVLRSIGNHEASDGDHFKHYEAIAWGETYGNPLPPTAAQGTAGTSSATTALGAFMTKHTMYGMSAHGTTPSNTSRYSSTDVGLLHMVALDLNQFDPGQIAWLQTDLAAVNRSRTPWIMVMSHFPLFHSGVQAHLNHSLAHYMGDELMADPAMLDEEHFVRCDTNTDSPGAEPCQTIGEFQAEVSAVLQPLFWKYGVDIYNAGHIHSYESTWPLCNYNGEALCDGEQSYTQPKGTIHLTEGNGGTVATHPIPSLL